jgi:hypothetical protein
MVRIQIANIILWCVPALFSSLLYLNATLMPERQLFEMRAILAEKKGCGL